MSFVRALATRSAAAHAPRALHTQAVRAAAAPLRIQPAVPAAAARTHVARAMSAMGARASVTRTSLRTPIPSVSGPRRFLSSASESASATAAAPSAASSSAPVPDHEIKIMAHYLGAGAFEALQIPAALSARAWRFSQPHSVLIPLDGLVTAGGSVAPPATPPVGAPVAAAVSGAPSSNLAALFDLPPIPVAPIVRIPSASSTPTSQTAGLPASGTLSFNPTGPFLIAFQYGAVVFFNATEAMQHELLANVAAKDTAKLKDDYKIVVTRDGTDNFSCRFLTDSVQVNGMDLNSVRIISQILSQTVAMQHYESEANRLLIKLRHMLRPSERLKGVSTLGHTKSNIIVNYVAECSTAMVEVLTELKVLDRSEIVWGHGEYDPLWQGMRREFDMSDRFENLQVKLDLLRDSHPFFLQVIHQLQSHRMEIVIIALIGIEVLFGCLEIHHRYFS